MSRTTTLLFDCPEFSRVPQAAKLVAQALHASGYYVLAGPYWLPNTYAISLSTNKITAHGPTIQALVSQKSHLDSRVRRQLDEQAIILSEEALNDGLLLPSSIQAVTLPFGQLARLHSKKPAIEQIMAGALLAALKASVASLQNLPDYESIDIGYQAASKLLTPLKLTKPTQKSGGPLLSGIQSTLLGLLASGTSFISKEQAVNLNIDSQPLDLVVQETRTSDSAVSRALGAAVAGSRVAALIRANPDMPLAALQYAADAEVPLVCIVDSATNQWSQTTSSAGSIFSEQRRGFTLKPASVDQCWTTAQEAANLAEQWQAPVVIILDALVSQTRSTLTHKARLPLQRGQLLSYKQAVTQTAFTSYKPTFIGLSPRKLPGQPGPTMALYANTSLASQRKRQTKMLKATESQLPYLMHGPKNAEVTIVCMGYAVEQALAAITHLKVLGISANVLQIEYLQPFASQKISSALRSAHHLLIVEPDLSASLSALLCQQTGLKITHRLLPEDQMGLSSENIVEGVCRQFTHGSLV